MNFRTFVILMNIFFMIPSIHGNELKIETAKRVLDKLYQANGNLIFIKPGIRISDKEFAVAQYLSGENVIILERKLLQLCYEFGTDSMNALAFVLGHELMHCSSIQSKPKITKPIFWPDLMSIQLLMRTSEWQMCKACFPVGLQISMQQPYFRIY